MDTPLDSDIPLEPIGSGDKPPPYKKVAGGTHPVVADYEIPDGWKDTRTLYLGVGKVDEQTGLSTFNRSLSQDPEALFRFVSHQMTLPPRVHVHVKGSQRAGDSWEKKFHFKLDVTDTVLRPTNEEDGWYEPHIVCDGDGQEVYRGDCAPSVEWNRYVSRKTYERSRDLESGHGKSVNGSLLREDEGESRENDDNPGLMGWCERFCNQTGGANSQYPER